jgi:hydroxyquinol 1,2-dioxygenase
MNIVTTPESVLQITLQAMERTPDPRLRSVMAALTRHLHAFVREVELTEAEWMAGIEFLTATGQMCDDKRQEFILLSDTLGVSMLVDAINHAKPKGATETTVLGPFFVPGAPALANGADIAQGTSGSEPGEPTFVSGSVRDTAGKPIAGATIDVWQTDGEGFYDVQRPERGEMRVRGTFISDAQGHFSFRTVKPVSYPIPTDGPVGRMLMRLGRHPYRPAHIHFILSAPGHERVVTHLFAAGDPYLHSDTVFGVKPSLVVQLAEHPPGAAPDGSTVARPFHTLDYDFVLTPA